MPADTRQPAAELIRSVAARQTGLQMMVLFGSRARGDARAESDWDFAYLGDKRLDVARLLDELAEALDTDRVQLVDLETAGGLLRYRVCRDGLLLHEAEHDLFAHFWLDAVGFYCDASPVLEAGYEGILEKLGR
jgi:predicted nucleotidyltransferase